MLGHRPFNCFYFNDVDKCFQRPILKYYDAKGCRQKNPSYSVTLSLLPFTPTLLRLKVTCLISDKEVF